MVGGVCGELRCGHCRGSGLWSKSWEREMEECGVQRGVERKLVRVMDGGLRKTEVEVWNERCRVVHEKEKDAVKAEVEVLQRRWQYLKRAPRRAGAAGLMAGHAVTPPHRVGSLRR